MANYNLKLVPHGSIPEVKHDYQEYIGPTDGVEMRERAKKLFRTQHLAEGWLKAIDFLRTGPDPIWILDRRK